MLVTSTSHRSLEDLNDLVEVQSWWKVSVLCKGRGGGLGRVSDKNMARMKYTTRKGSPIVDSQPDNSRKNTRIENATRDTAWMF